MLLHDGVFTWASRTPRAPAVIVNGQRITYAELVGAVRELAAHFVAIGLKPGERVAVLLPKSLHSVVSVLGTLAAGGAYVPIDDQSPPARQLRLLDDGRVRVLVTTEQAWDRLVRLTPTRSDGPEIAKVFAVTAEASGRPVAWLEEGRTPLRRSEAPLPEVSAKMPAYVLYTSGSTGQPKGVVVSHYAAVSFVDWSVRTFGIDSTDRLINVTQLHFDLSVLDLFASFAVGAQVHVITADGLLRPKRLVELLCEEAITLWYSVPSTLGLLLDEGALGAGAPTALRHVMFAGEVFPVPRLRRLMQRLPGVRFHNLFGPTETNVCTFYSLPDRLPPDTAAIPIGVPCDHVQLALLDMEGRPVQGSDEGEICVGGPSVMLEYFGQPARTSAAFWPAGTIPGAGRLYRTGDRARRDGSGCLWFVGRRDRQIKHRGYRIELGEVEAALALLPGIREAAVTALLDQHGESTLCAVVVPEPEERQTLNVVTVKSHCGRLLPSYMVPRSIDFRTALPRTSTGKIDLRRLR